MNRPQLPQSLVPVPKPAAPSEPDPSDLWLALTAMPRPHRVVPFPRNIMGTDTPVGELAIWPLSQEEQMAANAEADRFTKKLLKDPQAKDQANLGYHHTYTNETAIQVLYRACRNAQRLADPAFPSPNLMRSMLTTDEVGVLFNHYLTVQQEVGPIVAWMPAEELEGLILRLQQGGSTFPFDTLSWEQQRILVSGMASRLVACWMAMSSAGLPPDVTTYAAQRLAELLATPSDPQEGDDTGEATQDATSGQDDGNIESPYGVTNQPKPDPDEPAPEV